jgi:hypothetical protein
MGRKHGFARRRVERKGFEESRIIDVTNKHAMRFWSQRLGVSEEEIAEVIRQVGPNTTAVALKLEAPEDHRVVLPMIAPRQ